MTSVKENGEKTMKQRQCIQSRMGLGLLTVAALVLALLPAPAQAAVVAVVCTAVAATDTTDTDGDGFTDYEECNGITLPDSVTLFSSCVGTSLARADCLNPDTKDLFVILVRATTLNPDGTTTTSDRIPANPLEFMGGLPVTIHQITPAQAASNRRVGATQKAVKVTEDLDVTGCDPVSCYTANPPPALGESNYGTPNDLDLAKVFTQRTINFVNSVYASVRLTPPSGLINTYIKYTIAHEILHMLLRTDQDIARYGGHHYKTGSGLILDQSVSYSIKGGVVTFETPFPTAVTSTDQTGIILK